MTLRSVLLALAVTVLSLPASAREPVANGALGANFNEHYEDVVWSELELAKASWLRLFLNIHQIEEAGAGHGAIARLEEARARGFRTILSLKFPYPNTDFPELGSDRFASDVDRLRTVLPAVMGKVDILVIGNEPYIESRKQDRDLDLNRYYEALAREVIAFRNSECGADCPTRLYMGALNRLDLKQNRTRSTDRWLAYVRETPEIEGVDIHPHLAAIQQSKDFLDYILPRLRDDQTFLVTEFSLVHWWRAHNEDRVSKVFAEKHNLPAGAKVWQVIAAAAEEPFSQQHWDEFLVNEPWFASRRFYLRNQMKIFRDTGRLAVATYGFRQGASMTRGGFRPDRDPWLLNSVFAPQTVRRGSDGAPPRNPFWLEQFVALQEAAQ